MWTVLYFPRLASSFLNVGLASIELGLLATYPHCCHCDTMRWVPIGTLFFDTLITIRLLDGTHRKICKQLHCTSQTLVAGVDSPAVLDRIFINCFNVRQDGMLLGFHRHGKSPAVINGIPLTPTSWSIHLGNYWQQKSTYLKLSDKTPHWHDWHAAQLETQKMTIVYKGCEK